MLFNYIYICLHLDSQFSDSISFISFPRGKNNKICSRKTRFLGQTMVSMIERDSIVDRPSTSNEPSFNV